MLNGFGADGSSYSICISFWGEPAWNTLSIIWLIPPVSPASPLESFYNSYYLISLEFFLPLSFNLDSPAQLTPAELLSGSPLDDGSVGKLQCKFLSALSLGEC